MKEATAATTDSNTTTEAAETSDDDSIDDQQMEEYKEELDSLQGFPVSIDMTLTNQWMRPKTQALPLHQNRTKSPSISFPWSPKTFPIAIDPPNESILRFVNDCSIASRPIMCYRSCTCSIPYSKITISNGCNDFVRS